jgi:putative hemolysin
MEAVVIVCLLALSFLFSGSEVAFFSLTPFHFQRRARGRRIEGLIRKVLRDPNGLLSIILLGNTAVNMYSSSLFAVLLIGIYVRFGVGEPFQTILNVVLYSLLLLIAGEITPKLIALARPYRFSSVSVLMIYPLKVLLTPVIAPLSSILGRLSNRFRLLEVERNLIEEVEFTVDSALKGGEIDSSEAELVLEGLSFIQRTVKDIMTPRTELEALPEDATVDEVVTLAMRVRHSRFPVYIGDLDNVVGMLAIPALIQSGVVGEDEPIGPHVQEVQFVPETMKLKELERTFQRVGGYVVVVDEYGGTAGVATEGDLAKRFTAEVIEDFETKEPVNIKQVDRGVFLVSGEVEVRDLERLLERDFDFDGSVAALILERMGSVPREGDGIEVNGVSFEVVAKDGERLERIKVVIP